MDEKIMRLRALFDMLFTKEIYRRSYIEVFDQEELVLSANEEGFIYIIDKMIELCEKKSDYAHCHLDEAGMADKCNKGIVISYIKPPW